MSGKAAANTAAGRQVTRNDVARAAGVSSAVVSYVMNNGPKRVSPGTAQKVRDAVEELGYKPNLTARALSSGSTRTLGLIIPDLINPFFAELAYAIERAARERNFTIVISHSEAEPEAERRQATEMESRQVDGLIIASVFTKDELTVWSERRAQARVFPPTVLLNAWTQIPELSAIGPDFVGGTRDAVRHLLSHGHPQVALITGNALTDPLEPREAGWLLGHTEAGLEPGPLCRGTWTRESGYELTLRLLESADPPSAVLAVSDLMAIGALRAAHESGVAVPDQLAVITFDGTDETEFSWPPLTAVRQPLEEMAKAAVDRVLLPTADRDDTLQVFDTPLIIRRSCGCHGGSGAPRTAQPDRSA